MRESCLWSVPVGVLFELCFRTIARSISASGTLEHAQQPSAEGFGLQADLSAEGASRRQIVAHESPRATKLYHRTTGQVSLDEIERIAI